MNRKSLLMGVGRHLLPIPQPIWQRQMAASSHDSRSGLAFMSEEHHLVRDLAVVELPRAGRPLPPAFFAGRLGLSLARVQAILDDLEKHMTFLFRNPEGEVVWAYPVTAETTPHRLSFTSGEQIYAA